MTSPTPIPAVPPLAAFATTGPGQFVTIDANYYYRLHNPGPERAVYCQFRTVPLKQPAHCIESKATEFVNRLSLDRHRSV